MVTRGLMPPGSLDELHAFARLPRRRREGLLADASRPCGRQNTHAEHALGRSQQIHGTPDRPPTVASLFEKSEARQPLVLRERRHVAIEPPADHLESKQRQPVLQAVQGDEISVPRHRLLATEITFESEQRKRIEAAD